jgi:hypothetical protein
MLRRTARSRQQKQETFEGWRPSSPARHTSGPLNYKVPTVIELLLAVCRIDNPATCKNVSLTYSAEALTPMQCMMRAEPEIAKWITEHPGWQTRRFTCRPAGRYAKT